MYRCMYVYVVCVCVWMYTFVVSLCVWVRATGDAEGMVKILADKVTDKILGMHIMGSNAGEMIAEGGQ